MSVRLLVGDCRDRLRELPDQSVHCCITSPPYWGLREYEGETGMIGLERTMEEHIENLVTVFREVRRVLRVDGTVWLNYGDAHAGSWGGQSRNGPVPYSDKAQYQAFAAPKSSLRGSLRWVPGLKAKDLMMLPSRVAMALQADGVPDLRALWAIEKAITRLRDAYCGELPDKVQGVLESLHAEYAEAKGESWWLRSEIIYHKTNPMPESATDRPANAHEKIYLLARSGDTTFWTHRSRPGTRRQPEPHHIWRHRETREESAEIECPDPEDDDWRRLNLWKARDYFYDAFAVRVPPSENTHPRRKDGRMEMAKGRDPNDRRTGQYPDPRPPAWKALPSQGLVNRDGGRSGRMGREPGWRKRAEPPRHAQYETGHQTLQEYPRDEGRALRNVWTMSTGAGFREAHFATFPADLVEPCVLAGTSEKGVCADCGAPWVRLTHRVATGKVRDRATGGLGSKERRVTHGRDEVTGSFQEGVEEQTTGWAPTCDCPSQQGDKPSVVPAVVMDPFGGAGTVGLVADRLQRDAVLIEIAPEYADMAERRITGDAPMFADVEVCNPKQQETDT